MAANETTPCSVLFSVLKKQGGISYKELASLLLSGRPLSDGRSPASRVSDRTWVSRFVVHAPAGSLQDGYFCDFAISALRVVARLKSREGRALSSEEVLALVCGAQARAMQEALAACRQDVSPYDNVLARLQNGNGLTPDERAEAAMVLFVCAGCTANVARAVARTMDFLNSLHGGRLLTPPALFAQAGQAEGDARPAPAPALQLLRIVDGYVSGGAYWVRPDAGGAEIGALSLEENAITNVGKDVSAHHARLFCEDGQWYVEGLHSRNGTRLVNGATREECVVEPPRGEREGFVSAPVKLGPGDELVLGATTRFVILMAQPAG